ncbi:MAG: argininosuccinate lyase [Anaerolineales bacterium]|nr:argininosuccinate lyase [Anaerolineales bacterium]MBM2848514.1 argininosuccinate lyase [Anaerolineales bacterium]
MRLSEPPADDLVHTAYARETGDAAILYEGISLADMAHVVGLMEANVIPPEAGGELIAALLEMHPAPPLDFALDPARGDLYSNREAYLRMLTRAVGWLSAGRARREATTLGYLIAVRARLLALAAALGDCVAAALDLAEKHRSTLFPDYTYLQPAQPTTFGHYVLTFVYPLLRDLDRARAAFGRTNLSPAGSGSVNGSRLPLDRARLAELLGFDGLVPHTRDAMWQADGPIEIAALITTSIITLDRLAEDLQIFSTAEFGLVELADRHTRTSVIMPQKKNPYSLAYVRGVCGESIGNLAAMAAVGKTPSGQIDNRIFAYGDIPRALDRATGAVRLMADVLRGLAVNADLAARRASEHFIGATDLAEVIMLNCGLDYKTAHDLVGRAVRAALESGETTLTTDLIRAAAAETRHAASLQSLTPEIIAEALDPARIVAARTGPGGAAEAPVAKMIAECRAALADQVRWRASAQMRIEVAETQLLMTAAMLKAALPPREEKPAQAAEPPGQGEAKPQSLEELADELFKDLPPPPNRRRRWRG